MSGHPREVVVNGARYRVGEPVGKGVPGTFRVVNVATGLGLHAIRFAGPDGSLPPPPPDAGVVHADGLRLEPAPAIEPHEVLRYVDLGDALDRAGLPEEAERAFEHARELLPVHAEALARTGLVLGRRGDVDRAGDLLARAVDLEPNWLPYHRACVRLLWAAGSLERARVAFEIARSRFERDRGLHLVGACLYHELGRPGDASALLDEAPDLLAADDLAAILHEHVPHVRPGPLAHRLDGVLAPGTPGAGFRERLRAQEKARAVALHRFAAARRELEAGRGEGVETMLREAHDTLPGDPFIAWSLGLELALQGRHDEALDCMASVELALPGACRTRHGLNLALCQAGAGAREPALEGLSGVLNGVVAVLGAEDRFPYGVPSVCRWAGAEGSLDLGFDAVVERLESLRASCRADGVEVPTDLETLLRLYRSLHERAGADGGYERCRVAPGLARGEVPPETSVREACEGSGQASSEPLPKASGRGAFEPSSAPGPRAWAVGERILDVYRVTRRHRANARGTVYQVHCFVTGLDYLVLRAGARDQASRRDLWTALSHLLDLPEHPCLARYPFFHFLDDEVLVFQPLMPKRPLSPPARRDDGEPGLSAQGLERLLDVGIQVARGLEQVHGAGIVHGTLAWESFSEDADGNVRMGGFWHARSVGESRAIEECLAGVVDAGDGPLGALLAELLRARLPVQPVPVSAVPPAWASPEHRRGEVLTPRTDVFGWGLLMATLILGEAAWDDAAEVPARLRAEASGLPPALLEIILGALAPDPADRWDEPGRVAERLAGLFEGVSGVPHEQRRPGIATAVAPRRPRDRARDEMPWRALAHALAAAGLEPGISRPFATAWRASARSHLLADLGVLEQALDILEEVPAGSADDVVALARIHGAIAGVLEPLGDPAGAQGHYARSVGLLGDLPDEEARAEFRLSRAATLLDAADCHLGAGDAPTAFDLAARAEELMMEAEEDPEAARWIHVRALCIEGLAGAQAEATADEGLRCARRAVALACGGGAANMQVAALVDLARVLRGRDLKKAALAALDRATAILREVPETDRSARVALGQVELLRFPLLLDKGRHDDADEAARRACRIFQELTLGGVEDAALARQAALAYSDMGIISALRSGPAEAIPWHEHAREIIEAAARSFGGATLAHAMAQVCVEEGQARALMHQPERAELLFERAVDILEGVVGPGVSLPVVGIFMDAIAGFALFAGIPWDAPRTFAQLDQVDAIVADVEAREGETRLLRLLRARTRFERGNLLWRTRSFLPAVEVFRQGLDELLDASRLTPSEFVLVGHLYHGLGEALHRSGDLEGAIEASRQGLGAMEAWARYAGPRPELAYERGRVLGLNAYRCLLLGDVGAALEESGKALAALREAVPASPWALPRLADVRAREGTLLLWAGRFPEAVEAFGEAEVVFRRMADTKEPGGGEALAFVRRWVERAEVLASGGGDGHGAKMLGEALGEVVDDELALASVEDSEPGWGLASAWEPVLRELVARARDGRPGGSAPSRADDEGGGAGRADGTRPAREGGSQGAGFAFAFRWAGDPRVALVMRLHLKGRAAVRFGLAAQARRAFEGALSLLESFERETLRDVDMLLLEVSVGLASIEMALFGDRAAARAVMDRARALAASRRLPRSSRAELSRARARLGIPRARAR